MRSTGLFAGFVETFVGTLGIGFVAFGIARGVHNTEKLVFVPIGLALAGYIYWRQRKRRRQ